MGVCQRRSNIQIKSQNEPLNYVFYRQKQLIQGLGLAFHSMFTHTMILKPCCNIYTLHLHGQQHWYGWYGHGHTSFEGEKKWCSSDCKLKVLSLPLVQHFVTVLDVQSMTLLSPSGHASIIPASGLDLVF